MKVDFTQAERKVIEEAFKKYTNALDVIMQIMTADGRLPPNVVIEVAPDRSGFMIQGAGGPIGPVALPGQINGAAVPEIEN